MYLYIYLYLYLGINIYISTIKLKSKKKKKKKKGRSYENLQPLFYQKESTQISLNEREKEEPGKEDISNIVMKGQFC